MARLRGTVPVAADPGSAAGRRLVRASWTVKQSWPNNIAVEIWMVGSLEQTLHATTRVRLLVLPGEAADRRAPRGLVACSLFFVFRGRLGGGCTGERQLRGPRPCRLVRGGRSGQRPDPGQANPVVPLGPRRPADRGLVRPPAGLTPSGAAQVGVRLDLRRWRRYSKAIGHSDRTTMTSTA